MKNLTWPIIGLHFMRHNSVVIDTTYGLIFSPHLNMLVKSTASEVSAKHQSVFINDTLTIPPKTTKAITAFVNYPSEWNTTGIVTPLGKFTVTASLLISHSISTKFDKGVVVRITNPKESPYTIRKNTQVVEFSVVTPEQPKFL